MKKRDKPKPRRPVAAAIGIDSVLAQLASMKDNAQSFLEPNPADPEGQEIWKADIKACETATAILTALQDEGVNDPEQVRDMIADYRALGEQYQKMHQRYEVQTPPLRLGSQVTVCPECNTPLHGYPRHCFSCGKRLKWW